VKRKRCIKKVWPPNQRKIEMHILKGKVKVEVRKAEDRDWENKCSELENKIGYARSAKE
jgi:hypothetical protein